MQERKSLAIIGGGIIGLMTAAEAVRRGHAITIYSDLPVSRTTSWKAAASFKPAGIPYTPTIHHLVARSWAGWERHLREHGLATGVRMHTHWEAASSKLDPPFYLDIVKEASWQEFPAVPGGYRFAWKYQTFFIDMPVFLPWMRAHLLQQGVLFETKRFHTKEQILSLPQQFIINACGYGAKKLTGDPELIADKGQSVILDLPMPMDWSISADGFYIYPRAHETLLGGTNEFGVDNEEVDQNVIELLINGNKRILSNIRDIAIKERLAGIRPFRKNGPRIEAEFFFEKLIVHNYGHGGAGVTLSTGSAEAVLDIIYAI